MLAFCSMIPQKRNIYHTMTRRCPVMQVILLISPDIIRSSPTATGVLSTTSTRVTSTSPTPWKWRGATTTKSTKPRHLRTGPNFSAQSALKKALTTLISESCTTGVKSASASATYSKIKQTNWKPLWYVSLSAYIKHAIGLFFVSVVIWVFRRHHSHCSLCLLGTFFLWILSETMPEKLFWAYFP